MDEETGRHQSSRSLWDKSISVRDKNHGKNKFAQRAQDRGCVSVEYPRDRKGYRIWMSNIRQIVHSRDVKFTENTEIKSHNMCDLDDIFTPVEKIKERGENDLRFVEFFSRKRGCGRTRWVCCARSRGAI